MNTHCQVKERRPQLPEPRNRIIKQCFSRDPFWEEELIKLYHTYICSANVIVSSHSCLKASLPPCGGDSRLIVFTEDVEPSPGKAGFSEGIQQ